ALIENEEYEAALEEYDSWITKLLREKDCEDFLLASLDKSLLQHELNAYEAAKTDLETALSIVMDHPPEDSTLALLYHKLGVSHYYLEAYQKSINYWKKAIDLRSTFLPANHNDIAKGYKNIGSALEQMNALQRSEKSYKKSVDLLLSNPNPNAALLANNYRELGYLNSLKNDIQTAKTYYSAAQKLYEAIYEDEPWHIAILYADLSSFFLDTREYGKVIAYGQRTLDIYESIAEKYEDDYYAMADAYNNIGTAYLGLGEKTGQKAYFQQAIEPLQQAIKINHTFYDTQKAYESTNRTNLALAYKALKQFEKAFEQIKKTLVIDESLDDNISLAINTNNRGEIHFDQRNYAAALEDFQTAIQLLVTDFEADDFTKNPKIQAAIIQDRISLVEVLQNKAKTLEAISKDSSYQALAIATYDSLFVLIHLMQNEVAADASKRFLAAKSKRIFESAIRANLAFHRQTGHPAYLARCFELTEQSKAVSLLDQLSESQAKSQANIPDGLLQRELDLKRTIKDLEQEIFEAEKAQQSSVDLRAQLITNNRLLEKLIDTLEQQYSSYHQLKYAASTTNLSAIQQEILAPNQAMIQYFVGDAHLFILYADQQQTKIVPKALPSDLLQQIETFRMSIIEQNMEVASYQKLAFSLYELLLEDVLEKTENIERLIIIPDGVLAYLPFEILTTAFIENENDFRFLPYLLKPYAISYAYSASILAKQQAYRSEAKQYLAAFAPSYEEALKESDQLTRLLVRNGNYNLPGALEEVKAVNQLMGGDLFSTTQATEALFKSIAHNYKNLHLSMHGIVNDSFPLRSKLLFYDAKDDNTEDASLFAYELYNMQLNTDLVVLSACNTGMGQLQKGEGVMSLSHAFAYAGVASTVMSLWQVPDASTSTLIQDFYRHLKTAQPKDIAMQQAKLDFLNNTISLKQAHPFYWAALLNYGNQMPVQSEEKFSYWIWGLIGVSVLGLIFLGMRK
ncbi:MAG: CHAT domain-containing tetratricopeptide repeat protein, partial [Bacteroidota bacterium]